MKKTILGILVSGIVAAGFGPVGVKAAIRYGDGYYTNLCGSGTAATTYTCESDCDPATGSCTSKSDGAVRYVCRGNWNQCLENEVGWVNGVSLGNPGCGNTVQLSVYDKKCRREDGSWDTTCRLLGYMVWYSGECRPGVAGYATGIPLAPTATSVPTTSMPSSKFSSPTPSLKVSPTVTKPQAACSKVCGLDSDCSGGLFCINGLCRNRDCPADNTCFCGLAVTLTKAATGGGNPTSPETGMPVWLWGLGVLLLGFAGVKLLGIGKILWQ